MCHWTCSIVHALLTVSANPKNQGSRKKMMTYPAILHFTALLPSLYWYRALIMVSIMDKITYLYIWREISQTYIFLLWYRKVNKLNVETLLSGEYIFHGQRPGVPILDFAQKVSLIISYCWCWCPIILWGARQKFSQISLLSSFLFP